MPSMSAPHEDPTHQVVDWPPPRRPRRRLGVMFLVIVLAAILFGGGTTLSYYVEALWFDSLGFAAVFWRTLNLQAAAFGIFAAITFGVLYGSFLALKPARLGEIAGGSILINGQPLRLPVEPVLRLIALVASLGVAAITGAGMMAEWSTLALYWYGRPGAQGLPPSASVLDPIFGRPVAFYLFTLPAWEILSSWLLTLAVLVCALAGFFVVISGGTRLLTKRHADAGAGGWRGLSIAFAGLLLMLAARVYLGR